MDVVAVVDEGPGNSAYVVDLGDGGALVVDPARDPRPYLSVMEARGLTGRFARSHRSARSVLGVGGSAGSECFESRPAAAWLRGFAGVVSDVAVPAVIKWR